MQLINFFSFNTKQKVSNLTLNLYKKRIIGFDFLRGVAIILTLSRPLFLRGNLLWHIGWSGVHIFFILSSFLITNILLTEYNDKGKIKFSSFFLRRALKIYPLYYLFIIISILNNNNFSSKDYRIQFLGQILHIQNYTGMLWYHTWSLAAEEQFYICISIILYIYTSTFNKLYKLIWLLFGLIILAPILRYHSTILNNVDWFASTQYIMDSFAFGAILAITKFIYPAIFKSIINLKHFLLIIIFCLLIPLFVLLPGNLFMNTAGMSMMYLAFTLLITYFLSIESIIRSKNIFTKIFIKPVSYIGIASYSIYLFHVPLKSLIDKFIISEWQKPYIVFSGCIITGFIIWYLIEKPIALYKSKNNFFKHS